MKIWKFAATWISTLKGQLSQIEIRSTLNLAPPTRNPKANHIHFLDSIVYILLLYRRMTDLRFKKKSGGNIQCSWKKLCGPAFTIRISIEIRSSPPDESSNGQHVSLFGLHEKTNFLSFSWLIMLCLDKIEKKK